ncbi:hypothetical protein AS361_04890 [Myroides marinus]|uniref:hypothetical protein n=1 Tax=Myroides marinus TaxID=703342 RepID=UPI000741B93F|nr:hypothetical protein [Myroides marinus]KUF46474.1 hypothetical protein AS361_04890 [Myroides marinus]
MKITSQSGEVITLEEAIKYTSLFQKQNPNAINSYFIGIEKLQELLKQNNCIGMRIYPGINNQTEQSNLVLIGVDKNGVDISEGVILEELITCPPLCPNESSLLNRK